MSDKNISSMDKNNQLVSRNINFASNTNFKDLTFKDIISNNKIVNIKDTCCVA